MNCEHPRASVRWVENAKWCRSCGAYQLHDVDYGWAPWVLPDSASVPLGPPQPSGDSLDTDLSRVCEAMVQGRDATVVIPFTMALMERAGAHDAPSRLEVLARVFEEAAEKIRETIRFGEEAGDFAAEDF